VKTAEFIKSNARLIINIGVPLTMRRRNLVQLAAATIAAPSLSVFAQSFPTKPIKLLVAFPAGGPTDITMRQLADNAGKALGQPVIVENKPGAGGTLPAQQLQIAAADGYTVAQIPLGVFRLPYTTPRSAGTRSRTSAT
jgi:tripartite-type tricarboxylate transporter receptor subunit TctC